MLDITLVNVVTGTVVISGIVLAVVAVVLVIVVIVPTAGAVVSMLLPVLGLGIVTVFEDSLGWTMAGLLWLPLVLLVLDGGFTMVVGSGVTLGFLLEVLCGSGGKSILSISSSSYSSRDMLVTQEGSGCDETTLGSSLLHFFDLLDIVRSVNKQIVI